MNVKLSCSYLNELVSVTVMHICIIVHSWKSVILYSSAYISRVKILEIFTNLMWKYFNENFETSHHHLLLQRICKFFSTKLSKTAICKNFDSRNISTIRYANTTTDSWKWNCVSPMNIKLSCLYLNELVLWHIYLHIIIVQTLESLWYMLAVCRCSTGLF